MKYQEGKHLFIEEWGKLGMNWGINKTMAHIHAYLLMSKDPTTADDIRNFLDISVGNVNKNLHILLDWKLIYQSKKEGHRKKYYHAEKDMWTIFTQIVIQRKEKELDPMITMLSELSQVKGQCEESKEFCIMVNELKIFSSKAEVMLQNLTSRKSNWLIGGMMKFIK